MSEDRTPKIIIPRITKVETLGFNTKEEKGDVVRRPIYLSGFQGDLFLEFTDLQEFVHGKRASMQGDADVTKAVLHKFFSTEAVFGQTGDVDRDGNPVSQKTNIFLPEQGGEILPELGTIGLFSIKVNAFTEPKVDNTNLNYLKEPDTSLLPTTPVVLGLRIVFRALRDDGKGVIERTLSKVVGWEKAPAVNLAGGLAYIGIRVFDGSRKLIASSLAKTSNLAVPGDITKIDSGQMLLRYSIADTSSKPVDHGALNPDGQAAFANKPLSEFDKDFTGCYALESVFGAEIVQNVPIPEATSQAQRDGGEARVKRIPLGGSFYEVLQKENDHTPKRLISPYVLRVNHSGRYLVGWIRRAEEYPTTGSQGPAFKEVMQLYSTVMKEAFGSEDNILVVVDTQPRNPILYHSKGPTGPSLGPDQLAIPDLNESPDAIPSARGQVAMSETVGDLLVINLVVQSKTPSIVVNFQQYSQAETFPPFTLVKAEANWRDVQAHMRRVNASIPTGVTMHKYGGGGGFMDFFKAFCDMRDDGFNKDAPSFAAFKAALNELFVKTSNSPHRETQRTALRTAFKTFTDSKDERIPKRKFLFTLQEFFDREWQKEIPNAITNAGSRIPPTDGLSDEGKKVVERIKQDVLAEAYLQWLQNDDFRAQLHALGIRAEPMYTYRLNFTPVQKGAGRGFISGSLGGFLLEISCFHFDNDADAERVTPKFWLEADEAKEGPNPDGKVGLQGAFGSLGIGFKFSKTPLKTDNSDTKTGGGGSAKPIDFDFHTSLQLMPDDFIGARVELAALNFGPSASGKFARFSGNLRFGLSVNTISIYLREPMDTVLEAEVQADTFSAGASYPGKDAQSFFDTIYAIIQNAGDLTTIVEGGTAIELQLASAAYGFGWIASFTGNSGDTYDADEYDPEKDDDTFDSAAYIGRAEVLFRLGKFQLEPKAEKQLLVHIATYRALFTQRTASLVCHGFASAEHTRAKRQSDADAANKLLSLKRAATVANFMVHVFGAPGESDYLDPRIFVLEVYGKGPVIWYKRLEQRKAFEEGTANLPPEILKITPTVHPFDPAQDAVKLEGQARLDRLLAEREGVSKTYRKVVIVTTHQVVFRVQAN